MEPGELRRHSRADRKALTLWPLGSCYGLATEPDAASHECDGLIFGRVAYDPLAEYWPTAGASTAGDAPGGFTTAERANEFARLMNSITKIVVSHAPRDLPWGPAENLHGDHMADAIRAL